MSIVTKILREIYNSLTAAGWMWLGLPVLDPPQVRPAPNLDEPPRGHPERLRPDIALTTTELALQRQLVAPIGDQR
ncbi:hypothetical protein OHB53_15665 [Streptomyces sp. NBC_00056]|uniref:DUF6059 family protein n=1 Tax=unclassified Streptomyces TaxID=2593676 RepID=UPI00224F800B|nr:DUF6059 family protein [Streptomyces sp. NBC_00569]MCX5440116.1 hypothetical protein [Streptomyces sp. NBC_00063]WSE17636.1 hypothetical protein OG518_32230 [Streptomyces sp. NBC_01397]WUB93472.1 hypothetical protein OHO83_14810 [Streptomyces sp. NBC_00569]